MSYTCEFCGGEIKHSTVKLLGVVRTFEIMCECRRDRKYFDKLAVIEFYCDSCQHDKNKDSDPTCNTLNELLTGKVMFSCKKYKKLWRNV